MAQQDVKHAIIGQLVEQNTLMGARIMHLEGELKAALEKIAQFGKKIDKKGKAPENGDNGVALS